jgi:hypothetical protein
MAALADFLDQQGADYTTEDLYRAYIKVKERWQNNPSDMTIIQDGALNEEFATAVFKRMNVGPDGQTDGSEEVPDLTETGETEDPQSLRASFMSILQMWGITLTDNLMKLVRSATQNGWSYDAFTFYLRKTPEYLAQFPGIIGPDGKMTMSESQYLSNIQQYESLAAQYGVDLSESDQAWLFSNEISPDEFAVRAKAMKLIEKNPDLYKQFEKSLIAEGVIAKGESVSDEELLRFVMGEGNSEWYDVWNLTRTRYVATQAGIRLAKGADAYLALNPHLIEKLADKGLSDEALASGFGEVAENLSNTLPLSKLQKYGLTKADLVQASFGGPKAQEVRDKIARIQQQDREFYESRANPQSFAAEGGGLGVQGIGTQRGPSE